MGEQLKVFKIKSVDKRPFYIPNLKFYPSGAEVSIGKEIKVTEKEKQQLLKTKNGKKFSFIEVFEERPARKTKSEE